MTKFSLIRYTLVPYLVFLTWIPMAWLAGRPAQVLALLGRDAIGVTLWFTMMIGSFFTPLLALIFIVDWRKELEAECTPTSMGLGAFFAWFMAYISGMVAIPAHHIGDLNGLFVRVGAGLLATACLAFTVLDVMQLRRRLQTASTANRH